MARWVGFDMDECLGSFMPLHSFIDNIPRVLAASNPKIDLKEVMFAMLEQIINSEMRKDTWMLRPAMIDALKYVYKAHKSGFIEGAFIFSNNGSEELVNFVGLLCNGILWRLFSDVEQTRIFKMCIHYGSPFRSNDGVKDFQNIQNCLAGYELPLLSSPDDLLFFDDLEHVLASESRHYVKIRPYFNYTPIDHVAYALSYLQLFMDFTDWADIYNIGLEYQKEDLRSLRQYIPEKPDADETKEDRQIIKAVFRGFFESHGLKVGGGEKKRNAKSSKTRKVSRRL